MFSCSLIFLKDILELLPINRTRNFRSFAKILFKITKQRFFPQIIQKVHQFFFNFAFEDLPTVSLQIPSTNLSKHLSEVLRRLFEQIATKMIHDFLQKITYLILPGVTIWMFSTFHKISISNYTVFN